MPVKIKSFIPSTLFIMLRRFPDVEQTTRTGNIEAWQD